MLNENLTDCVRGLKARKEALEAELKLVADELAECEGRLKAEQERAAAVVAACRANKFLHDRRTRRLAEFFKDKGLLISSLQETTPLLKTRYKIAKMIYGAQNALVPVLKVLVVFSPTGCFISEHCKSSSANILRRSLAHGMPRRVRRDDGII